MTAHTWITAGLAYWGRIRQISAQAGTTIEESKGLLTRTFTLRGTNEQVLKAYNAIDAMRAEIGGADTGRSGHVRQV